MWEVGLESVVRFLRQREKLTVSGDYRLDMRHIVMSLNNHCIDFIKQEFQFNDNRLDLLKFVWLMREALDHDPKDHFISYQLVKLFEEIDIDASHTIQWGEFLEYLSQSNWLSAPPSVRPANARDGSLLVHAFHQEAKYRKHALRRVVEVARHNTLALLASNHSLSFLPLDRTPALTKPAYSLPHIDCTRVLAVDYAEDERLFGVLLTNRNLVFVEDGEMQKTVGVVRSAGNEVDIRYLPLHRLWVLESVNAALQVFPSPKGGQLPNRIAFRPHQEPLTAVREVGWPLTLCTASLDGLLKLWQVGTGRLVIELDVGRERGGEAERKGVKGVATYNRAGVAYLCTWMFTSEIFLWLPSLSLSKPFAGELHGHLGLVTDCVFAWRGELISLDDKRAVRVWNPEKLECLQSFTISEQGCSLLVLRAQPYLLAYSRLIDFYRIRTNSKADLQSQVGSAGRDGRNVLALQSQGSHLLAVQFSPYYSYMVVLTSQELKLLDVNTTNSIAAIRPPATYEFLWATMKGERRVCLATSAGTVEERKVEDGQLVRKIQVCSNPEAQDLKFIIYHDDTKILVAVVEGQNVSKIVTFDMLVESSETIKEIEFEQVGLQELRAYPTAHRFFILSLDPAITVWDYDKLVILNRIDLQACLPGFLSGGLSFIAEPINNSLLLQSSKGVAVLRLDEAGGVEGVTTLDLPDGSSIAATALLLQRVPCSYLEEEQAKRTKREMQFQGKKKVEFKILDKEADAPSSPDATISMFLLAVALKKGEISYYRLDQILQQTQKMEETQPLRGKVQRVKQHRRAHMRPFLWNGKTDSFSPAKFTQQYSFVSGVEEAGSVLSMFYFYTSQNQLIFLSPYGHTKAEWALSLPRPKLWNAAYNEIQEVLSRLEKTERALQHIYQVPMSRFKVDFLIHKYLTSEEVEQLARAEERANKESKSSAFLTHHQIGSQKSMVSINEKLGQTEKEEEKPVQFNPIFRKQNDNLFDKKLQQHEKRRIVNRNTKALFQKVQRSLSYSRAQLSQNKLQAQPQPLPQPQPLLQPHQSLPVSRSQTVNSTPLRTEKASFAVQMDAILNSMLKIPQPLLLQNSSVKSGKKDGRTSANNQNRPQSNIFRSRSSAGIKNRIKSSLGQLSKNFTAGKIEWQNFKKGIASEGLAKKGKLKL